MQLIVQWSLLVDVQDCILSVILYIFIKICISVKRNDDKILNHWICFTKIDE